MKKKILFSVVVIIMTVAIGWNYAQKRDVPKMSNLALTNIEALADGEGEQGHGTCYNTITTLVGSKILYCSTCTYIPDSTNSWVSGTGSC